MENELKTTNWTRLHGRWETETNVATYRGNDLDSPIGLILGNCRARNGRVEVKVRFLSSTREREARLVFKCDASTEEYFAAGLGGWGHAYCLHYGKGIEAYTPLAWTGNCDVLLDETEYQIGVHVAGRAAVLSVDGNEVLRENLPRELAGDRLGLYSYGDQQVEFTDLQITPCKRAFAIMQFGGSFDSLYDEVIVDAAKKAGFDPHRADKTLEPGAILDDIIRRIGDADVVIAEVSSTPERCFNPNVFYELGYARSLAKPTILLAREGTQLPFDICHLRCTFYEDSPDGRFRLKGQLQDILEQELLE